MHFNIKRWFSYVVVFIVLTSLWVGLAAAASPQLDTETAATPTPVPGLLEPGSPTFGLIIGAIVIVTIVIASSLFRKQRKR
jgi:hypothetical protein